MQHFNKELQTKVIDEDVDYCHKKIPHNLRSTLQRGPRETNMTRHPKSRQESDGELKDKGSNVRCEGDETEAEDLSFEDIMIENIVQRPFQHQIQSTASPITEQLETHHLAERRVEKVNDFGQSALYPRFYASKY